MAQWSGLPAKPAVQSPSEPQSTAPISPTVPPQFPTVRPSHLGVSVGAQPIDLWISVAVIPTYQTIRLGFNSCCDALICSSVQWFLAPRRLRNSITSGDTLYSIAQSNAVNRLLSSRKVEKSGSRQHRCQATKRATRAGWLGTFDSEQQQ